MKKSSFIDPVMQLPGIQPLRLMQLSLLMIRTDVNMPDNSGYILSRSDARALSISGMPVQVDLLSIINSNLLIIRIFCQFFVDKKFELRSGVCDMIRQLADMVGCLFYYNPHKQTPRPLNSPAHGGRRPPKKKAKRNLTELK